MKEYELIKDFISGVLFRKQDKSNKGLNSCEIDKQILAVKNIWESNKPSLCALLECGENELANLPTDHDFNRMKKDFEAQFNVELEKGIMIQGESSKRRNTSWWTNEFKLEGNNYYSERNRKYQTMQGKLSKQVIYTIDLDTDNILDNIENPITESFDIYGMVVGHVQSGKTGNYTNLVCKAADAGYKFIVVVAGGTDILRNQTQERINNDFIGFSGANQVGVGLLPNYDNSLKPVSLTTLEADFNKADAIKASQGLSFDTISTPVVLVIKRIKQFLSMLLIGLTANIKMVLKNMLC